MELSKLLDSELAYRILRQIRDGRNTPTEIAEELDTSSNSISNYLRDLKKAGLVEKSESKGRKQPYKFTEEGLVPLFMLMFENDLNADFFTRELTYERLEDMKAGKPDLKNPEELDKDLENPEVTIMRFGVYDRVWSVAFEENQEEFIEYLFHYIGFFLEETELSTIRKIYTQFKYSSMAFASPTKECPPFLKEIAYGMALGVSVNEGWEGYQALEYANKEYDREE